MEIYETDYDDYDDIEDDTADNPDEDAGVDYLIYDDGYIEQEPRWTRRRIILFMIAVMMIFVVLVVLFAPLLQDVIMPQPAYIPPLATPASQL